MREVINRLIVSALNVVLNVFRLPGLNSPRIYAIWGAPWLQPTMERLSQRRAFDVYRRAQRLCPAYRNFLDAHNAPHIRTPADFARIPETTKENYVKAYSIEQRCHHGTIPRAGVIIDESSGSSGTPNNWVRGADERASIARLIRHAFRLRFEDRPMIFLNAFALGPWATGMNVSMAMADASILKSIGPDADKLERTLTLFGATYEYVIAGYPPFIKDWLDRTSLNLAQFRLHLICGGEGYSLGLRARFEEVFHTVISSYGASDLEINIAAETDTSITLRTLCHERRDICKALFGRDDAPMIFQYNPIDYHVEQSEHDELVITLLRRATVAPKIRYNIRDLGGAVSSRRVAEVLQFHDVNMASLSPRQLALPFLYVFGRNDLSVPFYGAKVFSTDLDRILNSTPELRSAFLSFQLEVKEDAALEKVLIIHLERTAESPRDLTGDSLAQLMYSRLQEVNQDFREVSRLFGPEHVDVRCHAHGTGPFANHDIRLKRRYVATSHSEVE